MNIDVENALKNLRERIISCERCPRLRAYCQKIAQEKKKSFRNWEYWGKPLPGFGDSRAKLLIIGLAPAAHGGNRTGRMFTGDSSGDWLIRALYETKFANQPLSISRDDGLKLNSAYITAVVRCAPPGNKPVKEEIAKCSSYLAEELKLLENVMIVLTLGRVAFDAYLSHLPKDLVSPKPLFKHGATYYMGKKMPILMTSYHPSKQNTSTRKLTWEAWRSIFTEIRKKLT
jgi:uracil-DNA glycosylase family 4